MTILKQMAFALLGLLALLAVMVVASRLWPASVLQKQARAALEQPLDWPGANAWVLLETLNHDGLDMTQRQALVEERVRQFTAWKQENARLPDADADVQGRRQVPSLGGEPVSWKPSEVLCDHRDVAHCLDKVRQAPEAVAAELAARQGRLLRVAQLAGYGHVRSPYPGDVSMPFLLTTSGLFDPLAAHALTHVQGDSGQAMAGLCRDMGTGRMLLTRSDSLINAVVGMVLLQANGQLLAQVLAELPPEQALPAQCAAALAPLQAHDLGLCRAMRTDYAMSRAAFTDRYHYHMSTTPGSSWLLNVDKTLDRLATVQAQGCLAPMQQQLSQDLTAQADTSVGSLWRMECPANAIGCILTGIAGPDYANFVNRAQDQAAQQRLLGAVVWLRTQPVAGDIAQRLQHLPAELVSLPRPITVSADGRALQVLQRYANSAGAGPLSVPLPSAWWPDAQVRPIP